MKVKNLPPETFVDVTYEQDGQLKQLTISAGILARDGYGNLAVGHPRVHCPVDQAVGALLAQLSGGVPV